MKENIIPGNSGKKIIVICSFLTITIFAIDSLIPLGVAGGVPYILIILISLWSHRRKLPVYMAIAGSILTIVGFFSSPTGGVLWQVLTNRTLALFAIWTVLILSAQRRTIHEEKEDALLQVKALRGFLPICATCKKIRDDQGYWNQIESYIKEHSEAEFSHGICPDCATKVLADFNLNKDNRIHNNSINKDT